MVKVSDLDFVLPPEHGVDMLLLFDNSGSMGLGNEEETERLFERGSEPMDPDRFSIKSGQELIGLLSSDDRAQVMTFGTSEDSASSVGWFGMRSTKDLDKAVKVAYEFSDDIESLQQSIEAIDVYSEWHGTPLFNAIDMGLDELEEREEAVRSPIIVILADGDDNWRGTGADRSDVVSKANDMETPIFSIAFGHEYSPEDLRHISQKTGGVFAHSDEAEDLSQLFEGIGLGIFSGRVNLDQEAEFEESLDSDDYVAEGTVTSEDLGINVEIPFSFEFTID